MREQPHRYSQVRLGPGLLASALASVLATGTSTFGQSPAPSANTAPRSAETLPPGTILTPGAIAAPRMALPNAAVPASAPIDETDGYWIVSSRRCSDRATASNAACLEFFQRASEREVRNMGHDAFLASIRPDRPVCFVVHGSYNRWGDVVVESRKIARWVRSSNPASPVQVVFFTWPADGNMPFLFPVDIAVLGRRASQHSVYLAHLIGQLPAEQPICMIGHSHGARATVAALHLLGGGAVEDGQALAPGYSRPKHLRAVLIAAAIDHNWLNPGQRYGQALIVPEQVLLMRNSRDATLAIYPLRKGWSERAIGREGLGLEDRLAMDQMGKKIVELDAAQFAGLNHSFADYHEHTELAASIVPYIHFRADPAAPADAYEPAEPILPARERPVKDAPPKEGPLLGNPVPIQPAKREPPADTPPVNGPRLVPTSHAPPSEPEPPPAREEPILPKGQVVKIYPKSYTGPRDPAKNEYPPNVESQSTPKTKQRSPFQLWLEP